MLPELEALQTAAPIYRDWLRHAEGADLPRLDELCSKHPALEAPLRTLHEAFRLFEAELNALGLQDSTLRTLSQLIEPEIETAVTLNAIDGDPPLDKAVGDSTRQLDCEATLDDLAVEATALFERDGPTDGDGHVGGRLRGSDRYELQGEFARGAMGVILKVHDRDLSRTLAMKLMREAADPSLAAGRRAGLDGRRRRAGGVHPKDLARFLEEAQVTAQLDHPGIVPVHDLGLDPEGRLYFTMRLIRGRELGAIFELANSERDGWNLPRAVGAVVKACQALAYAHRKGVVHRDLKPANIMVGQFGEVYVMDWGLAKVVGRRDLHDDQLQSEHREFESSPHLGPDSGVIDTAVRSVPLQTLDGSVMGTPAYMSPEQAIGRIHEIDELSDVFSLGAILYTLLAGHPPHLTPGSAISAHSVIGLVRAGPPTPVAEVNPKAPPELVAICEKAMAYEKQDRYRSSLELAEDLQAYLDHRVVRAYRTGAVAEFRAWFSRNKSTALTAVAATLTVLIGLVIAVFLQKRLNTQLTDAKTVLEERNREVLLANIEIKNQEVLAQTRLQEILRLSDIKRLSDYENDARSLWPCIPDKAPELRLWLLKAEPLAGRLEGHKRTLASLRQLATATTVSDGAEIDGQRSGSAEATTTWRFADTEQQWQHDALAELVQGLEAFLATGPGKPGTLVSVRERLKVAETIEQRSVDDFREEWASAKEAIRSSPLYSGLVLEPQLGLVPIGPDPESGLWEFWHVQTGARPERGADGTLSPSEEHGLVLVLIPAGEFRMGSTKGSTGIELTDHPDGILVASMSPGYAGESLGLRPLDVVLSAAGSPTTTPDALTAELDGLLAGRPYSLRVRRGTEEIELQGATPGNVDPLSRGNEGPLRMVRLDAFFLAKYEMTQAQWLRFTGENPSVYDAGRTFGDKQHSLLHPVENVSWVECKQTLTRLALRLPTEAQWEYAARAGTVTPWSSGPDAESLARVGNLADEFARANDGPSTWPLVAWNDGYTVHAPIGHYAPNAFGLHDVHGNVWEWCRDVFGQFELEMRPGDGERLVPEDQATHRPARGASYGYAQMRARSAYRARTTPRYREADLGVRPARPVTP